MESPLIEVTRSLYHLDYFRRNFRKLGWHQCEATSVTGADCLVCCFKNLFHELSLLMREAVLDPPHIRQVIESSIESARFGKFKSIGNVPGSVPAHIQFETLLRQLEDSSAPPESIPSDANAQSLKLHTEFSYTKICLHCRTTSYVESVTQYVMQIDATNFVNDDWPSFEFAIKTSLDAGEFCVQPNCHGQTKVFRLLRTLPHFLPMYFSDSASVSLITFLPTRLRPHLIFESSSSVADLVLKGLVLYSPQWGYATIFYHSRLELWVFIDSRRVLTLFKTWMESRFHPITHGFTVVFCFYCRDDMSTSNGSPNSHYIPPPTIPTKRIGGIIAPPMFPPASKSEYDSSRIYENWPLDTDSGQGSEFSSTNSSSSVSMFSNLKSPNLRDSLYSNSTKQSFEEGNSGGSGSSSRRNSPTKSPSILSSEGKETGTGKYATVRRKVKYHSRGIKGNLASLSMSAPDLRMLVPPAPSCPIVPLITTPIMSPSTTNLSTSSSRDNHTSNIGLLTAPSSTTLPVALSPVSPRSTSNFSDVSSICSSSKATDRSSGSKKVSFNCEVTLVDDPDDEYIPHPIFQSILQKLKQNGSGSRGSVSGGSAC